MRLLDRICNAFPEGALDDFADLDEQPLAGDNALEVRARGHQLSRRSVKLKTGSASEFDDHPRARGGSDPRSAGGAEWRFGRLRPPKTGVAPTFCPSPALRTTLGPRSTARKKYGLTDDQIVALINELPGILQLMAATAVSTGMRVSELCGLKWGSVDVDRGLVWVQETYFRGEIGETKTEESHRALALGRLGPAFERLRPADAKPGDYVFQYYGEPMDDRDILRRFIRPAAERLGLYFPGFGWRTFRRLNITAIQDGPDAVNVFEAMR